MMRRLGVGWALVTVAAFVGCAGPVGPAGKDGKEGAPGAPGGPGTGKPSVSAVTPASAHLGRTVDLTIAGSGTTWNDKTTVTFADPKIKVNKVIAASATGLLVNVTIGQDATVAATDVTVSDAATMEAYKGAFEIKPAIAVTIDQAGGVLQGGFANVHVAMLDLSTPFDAATTAVMVNSPDLGASQPTVTDFGLDLTVRADVLAKVGAVDLDVTSGAGPTLVDSQVKGAFMIAARAPTTLTSATPATGTIATASDTALFQYTPASAAQRFVQLTVGSMMGSVSGTVLPKSGKYADALAGFGIRFAHGTTSTDPFYVVVADGGGLFGAGPTPADLTLTAFDALCTAAAEKAETAAANNDTFQTAQPVTTLPALVSGAFGYGAVKPSADVDYYAITVTGAPKMIHVATGGDVATDTVLDVLDSTGTSIMGTSDDKDYQEDFTVSAATSGTYYVSVAASTSGGFKAAHNTYDLFIEVK